MTYEITETWRDQSIQAIMFHLRNNDNGEEYTCGVTQIAINDLYKTEDTIEKAQSNFDENVDFIISKAVFLINKRLSNEKGHFIITSEIINKIT